MLKVHRVKECILARTNEIDGNSSVMLNHGVYGVFGTIWMFSVSLLFPYPFVVHYISIDFETSSSQQLSVWWQYHTYTIDRCICVWIGKRWCILLYWRFIDGLTSHNAIQLNGKSCHMFDFTDSVGLTWLMQNILHVTHIHMLLCTTYVTYYVLINKSKCWEMREIER